MEQYYWVLELKDGVVIDIPPASAPLVQQRMSTKDAVLLRSRAVPYSEIKSFKMTDKPFGQPQRIADTVAQVFKEPELTADGGIVVQWVKRKITPENWERHYSKLPGYRKVGDDGGMVFVGWQQPIHLFDGNNMMQCTKEEVNRLTMQS